MALFGNKAKAEAYANQLAGKLDQCVMGDYLLADIFEASKKNEYYWLTQTISYYDSRNRTVLVGSDELVICNCHISKISNVDEVMRQARRAARFIVSDGQLQRAERLHSAASSAQASLSNVDSVALNYTAYGFRPLGEYLDENRTVLLDTNQVLIVWAQILKEKLKQRFPNLQFNDMIQTIELDASGKKWIVFPYLTRAINWNSWF